MSRIGDLIVRQRMLNGWTQGKLARKLDRSTACVSAWETGVRIPRVTELPELALAIRLPRRQIVDAILKERK